MTTPKKPKSTTTRRNRTIFSIYLPVPPHDARLVRKQLYQRLFRLKRLFPHLHITTLGQMILNIANGTLSLTPTTPPPRFNTTNTTTDDNRQYFL